MASQDFSSEESSQTAWARSSKQYLDTSILRGKTTMEEENSHFDDFYEEFDKKGATGYAKEIAEVQEEYNKGSAMVERSKKQAAQIIAEYMSEQEGFKKDNSDTLRRMDKDKRQ